MSETGTRPSVTAGVRFLLEVAALVVFGYWGVRTGQGQVAKVGLGLGIPLAVAVVWGLVGAPAAPYRLARPWRLALEVAILGGAALGLYSLGRTTLAVLFAAVAAVDTLLLYAGGEA